MEMPVSSYNFSRLCPSHFPEARDPDLSFSQQGQEAECKVPWLLELEVARGELLWWDTLNVTVRKVEKYHLIFQLPGKGDEERGGEQGQQSDPMLRSSLDFSTTLPSGCSSFLELPPTPSPFACGTWLPVWEPEGVPSCSLFKVLRQPASCLVFLNASFLNPMHCIPFLSALFKVVLFITLKEVLMKIYFRSHCDACEKTRSVCFPE